LRIKIHNRDEEHDALKRTLSTIAKNTAPAEKEVNQAIEEVRRVLEKLEKAEVPLNETDMDEEPVLNCARNLGYIEVPIHEHRVKDLPNGNLEDTDKGATDLVVSNTTHGILKVTLVATPEDAQCSFNDAVCDQQEVKRDLAAESEAVKLAGADPLASSSSSSTNTLGTYYVTLAISPEAAISRGRPDEDPRQEVAEVVAMVTADITTGQAASCLDVQDTAMKVDPVNVAELRLTLKDRVKLFVTKTANAVKNTGNRAKMHLIFNLVSSPNSHPARK
jgi:hypothetical protein